MSPSMLCLVSVQWQQWQMGSVVFAEWEHAYVEQDVGRSPTPCHPFLLPPRQVLSSRLRTKSSKCCHSSAVRRPTNRKSQVGALLCCILVSSTEKGVW